MKKILTKKSKKKILTKKSRTWLAWTLAGLWVAFAGWYQFLRPEPPAFYSSFHVQQPLAFDDPCRGMSSYSKPSFSQRYACTSNRRLSEGRAIFMSGVKKLAVMFGPPALVVVYYRRRKARAA